MRKDDPQGFEFPCEYQIKAMGLDDGDFQSLVLQIVGRHCDQLDPQKVLSRSSRNGKYLSVSVTVEATSLAHLDAIYADLTAHEKVLMRL